MSMPQTFFFLQFIVKQVELYNSKHCQQSLQDKFARNFSKESILTTRILGTTSMKICEQKLWTKDIESL